MLRCLRNFVLLVLLFTPVVALADGLTIVDVDTKSAPDISVYFDLRQSDGMVVTGITTEDCTLEINNMQPELISPNIKSFYEGDRGVGILFIFPVAKNYSEESFAIRSNLVTLIQKLDRRIDRINAIPYDNTATPVGWSSGGDGKLAKAVSEMNTSDVLEPNLFASFTPALAALESLQGVTQKYVVIISDAEGAIVGDPTRANRLITEFVEELKKKQIKPIVVAYSPDGKAAMTNAHLLQRIANNAGGTSYLVYDTAKFQAVLLSDVFDDIYKRYILEAEVDLKKDFWLDEGRYNLQLTVRTNQGDVKAGSKISWPKLSKSRLWLWITLGSVGGVILIVVLVLVFRRREEEEVIIDHGPEEMHCATCGKVIPEKLFGFNGEFCLSGGLPDCPYYQMPDQGKIQITKGIMADTTFFIKQEITTIGSYPENNVYLNDKAVSRKHAAIKADEGKRYEIRDFGSANGTYVNDERIERKFLRNGDIIRFGSVETVFKLK
ncbi:MAG: FHA domain-containing protein [Bradymonadales bacterium]